MIYEQNSFEPVAQLIWVRNGITAANDEPTAEERRDAEGWYGNNKPIIKKGVQVYHYHNDHLGTPNELTDQQGEVVWYADYQAWGNTATVEWKEQRIDNIVVSQEHLQPIRFQGQSFDTEIGLHYNRFRYFDPDMGMFTTRDPIGLMGGMNVFQYAPNPVGWIDPFGLKCVKDKTTSYNAGSRRDALQEAKRDTGIPNSQQPKVRKVDLEDGYGNKVLDSNYQPVKTREYVYQNNRGDTIVIQKHGLGHTKATTGHGAEPHFNTRPISNTRTGSVEGTHGHYNY